MIMQRVHKATTSSILNRKPNHVDNNATTKVNSSSSSRPSTSPHHHARNNKSNFCFTPSKLIQILILLPPIALFVGIFIFHHHLTDLTNATERESSLHALERVRQEFYIRYGGKEEAMNLYHRGIEIYGNSIQNTAKRLYQFSSTSKQQQPKNAIFPMSFGGYSVTVGRGNYFKQSYPFIMERILKPIFDHILHLKLEVRNAAIGGIPSFPYGFCLSHFMGSDAQVISWDYSMNEGGSKGSSDVLEAYLRHGIVLGSHENDGTNRRPMMILLDNNKSRRNLIREYQESGLLLEGITLLGKGNELASSKLLELPEEQRPLGYQNWNEFGSPKSCPGRGNWHPKRMEHELMGWLLAMYFVDAIEYMIINKNDLKADEKKKEDLITFPKSKSNTVQNNNQDESVVELLYGHIIPSKEKDDDELRYQLEHISCRTNFLPAMDEEKILPSIVVSGLIQNDDTLDIMKERSDELYEQGWVLDISKLERDTKRKVDRCGGLGYRDMKIALYGIPSSGPLILWLPHEGSKNNNMKKNEINDIMASTWFDDLVLCEANEKRDEHACQLDKDVKYTVGGIDVIQPTPISGAGEYLKRKTCINIGIPAMSKITKWSEVLLDAEKETSSSSSSRQLLQSKSYKPNDFGIKVIIQAKSGVTRKDGACCISHVVWEQH